MFLRRSAASLAAATVLCAVAAPAALAAPGAAPAAPGALGSARADEQRADKELPEGLYGEADPKYDGVWRQSVALLALDAAGGEPARKAVDWLAGQQCDDGSFTAFRADADKECDAKRTPADTNATGMAVQALSAVGGHKQTVQKSVDWLHSEQNDDGGWGYNPGSPSDANSVSVVIGALAAAGEKPAEVTKKGASPYDALVSFQLGCEAKPKERGAFGYQPDKDGALSPNDDATAAAALAGTGQGLQLAEPLDGKGGSQPVKPLDCSNGSGEPGADSSDEEADKRDKRGESGEDSEGGEGDKDRRSGPRNERVAAEAGASYLASVVKRNEGYVESVMPGAEGKPDYANTADSVIALAAGGHRSEADYALRWLEQNLNTWDKAKNDPSAIGSAMLARYATGSDPINANGTDLLKRLNATGPKPAKMPTGDDGDHASSEKKDEDDDSGSMITIWSMVAAGLAAGAGIGFLLSGRRKQGR